MSTSSIICMPRLQPIPTMVNPEGKGEQQMVAPANSSSLIDTHDTTTFVTLSSGESDDDLEVVYSDLKQVYNKKRNKKKDGKKKKRKKQKMASESESVHDDEVLIIESVEKVTVNTDVIESPSLIACRTSIDSTDEGIGSSSPSSAKDLDMDTDDSKHGQTVNQDDQMADDIDDDDPSNEGELSFEEFMIAIGCQIAGQREDNLSESKTSPGTEDDVNYFLNGEDDYGHEETGLDNPGNHLIDTKDDDKDDGSTINRPSTPVTAPVVVGQAVTPTRTSPRLTVSPIRFRDLNFITLPSNSSKKDENKDNEEKKRRKEEKKRRKEAKKRRKEEKKREKVSSADPQIDTSAVKESTTTAVQPQEPSKAVSGQVQEPVAVQQEPVDIQQEPVAAKSDSVPDEPVSGGQVPVLNKPAHICPQTTIIETAFLNKMFATLEQVYELMKAKTSADVQKQETEPKTVLKDVETVSIESEGHVMDEPRTPAAVCIDEQIAGTSRDVSTRCPPPISGHSAFNSELFECKKFERKCQRCLSVFYSKFSFIWHEPCKMALIKPKLARLFSQEPNWTRIKSFICTLDDCDESFDEESKFINHCNDHFGGQFKCLMCNYECNQNLALKRHQMLKHSSSTVDTDVVPDGHMKEKVIKDDVQLEKYFKKVPFSGKCDDCGQNFDTKYRLMTHKECYDKKLARKSLKINPDSRLYLCTECDFVGNSSKIGLHCKTHFSDHKSYHCKRCDYQTDYRQDIKKHVKSRHLKEKLIF